MTLKKYKTILLILLFAGKEIIAGQGDIDNNVISITDNDLLEIIKKGTEEGTKRAIERLSSGNWLISCGKGVLLGTAFLGITCCAAFKFFGFASLNDLLGFKEKIKKSTEETYQEINTQLGREVNSVNSALSETEGTIQNIEKKGENLSNLLSLHHEKRKQSLGNFSNRLLDMAQGIEKSIEENQQVLVDKIEKQKNIIMPELKELGHGFSDLLLKNLEENNRFNEDYNEKQKIVLQKFCQLENKNKEMLSELNSGKGIMESRFESLNEKSFNIIMGISILSEQLRKMGDQDESKRDEAEIICMSERVQELLLASEKAKKKMEDLEENIETTSKKFDTIKTKTNKIKSALKRKKNQESKDSKQLAYQNNQASHKPSQSSKKFNRFSPEKFKDHFDPKNSGYLGTIVPYNQR